MKPKLLSPPKPEEVLVKGYTQKTIKNRKPSKKRLLISAPMTGNLRSEWVLARYSQVVPCNWSMSDATVIIDSYSPLGFLVAEARNVACDLAIKENFDWVCFIDHDVILPPDFFLRINDVMIEGKYPVWGGLYFTKSIPSEPLIYRGVGNGYYDKWHFGDKVWVDGYGLGCHLINGNLIREIGKVSPWYECDGRKIRQIFESPSKVWFDPENNSWEKSGGTEDLFFYNRLIKEGILANAGWPELQKKQFPFMCDTSLFCRHIDESGRQFPIMGEEMKFVRPEKKKRK